MKYLMSFFLSMILYACANPPDITIGQTYFNVHKIRSTHANALDTVSNAEIVEFSGVYGHYTYGSTEFPALIRLNAQNQLTFLLLDDSLAAQDGDVVTVSGTTFDSLLVLSYAFTQQVCVLRINNFKIDKQTHPVLRKAQQDYQKFKTQLQQKAKQPGSKLSWPDEPEWQLFVDEKRSKIIVYFGDADLMYALDVNMVYDLNGYTIEHLYAREWFKGE